MSLLTPLFNLAFHHEGTKVGASARRIQRSLLRCRQIAQGHPHHHSFEGGCPRPTWHFGDVYPGGAVEQHWAGHGVQVQHDPDALGPRLCVPNDDIRNVVAGIGAQIALEHFEGCTGSLQ